MDFTDINNCIPNPCKNYAECEDLVDGHKCICKPGYTGPLCETGMTDHVLTMKYYITSYRIIIAYDYFKILMTVLKTPAWTMENVKTEWMDISVNVNLDTQENIVKKVHVPFSTWLKINIKHCIQDIHFNIARLVN